MKWNMVMWLNIIEEAVKGEPWIIDLELKFMRNDWSVEDTTKEREILTKVGDGWEMYVLSGAMVTPAVMFSSKRQSDYYETWSGRLREICEGHGNAGGSA